MYNIDNNLRNKDEAGREEVVQKKLRYYQKLQSVLLKQ